MPRLIRRRIPARCTFTWQLRLTAFGCLVVAACTTIAAVLGVVAAHWLLGARW